MIKPLLSRLGRVSSTPTDRRNGGPRSILPSDVNGSLSSFHISFTVLLPESQIHRRWMKKVNGLIIFVKTSGEINRNFA